jgi:regulator of protease activity HflC (stomatin/prohibitin superfamily)
MLSERERLNTDIQAILDQRTDNWGIKVANVEIKHVDLDESMIRAIAQQAEAERARRAKIINAEGEKQAASMLAEAAKTLSSQKQALQLRYLQTLKEVAGEKTNTIIFPLPLDLITPLMNLGDALNKDQ